MNAMSKITMGDYAPTAALLWEKLDDNAKAGRPLRHVPLCRDEKF
jgi:hypothetical protein